jgi:outer membrane lipoprotein carrier protein
LCGALLSAQSTVNPPVTLPVSFKAHFKQTITNDQKKQIIYLGKIDFSTPNHFKWRYSTPTKKEVCTDGVKLRVVDHDLEQVSTYMIDKGLDLPAILESAKPHRKSVYVARYQDKSYTIQVNNRQELSRIAYKDDLDNTVLIVFSKMRYSAKKIPVTQMRCSYPDAYDRIGE